MDLPVLIVSLALGAAALAIWVDVRLPSLAPTSIRGLVAHLIAALIVCQVGSMLIGATADTQQLAAMLTAVLALALPVLVYAFLTGVWMIKMAQNMLGRAVR